MPEENNNNYGIASFECGRGNTMRIDFPNVIEADAHMNIGVALMPFMEDGFHFIKEDNISSSQEAEGLNEVETGFVKYLYEIRKANRDNKKLEYKIFSGPNRLWIRERIFLAGKIFPVMSISYSGEDIDCSTSKIQTKSVSKAELKLMFEGIFEEDKAFSNEYLSIDNDNIRLYLPQNTAIGIDYKNLLIDFLTNGTKTETAATHGEFPDLETYTLATGETQIQDGCWLTKNREANNATWQNACMFIVKHKLQGVLAPFSQIADFYTLLDDKITNETQHTLVKRS